MRTPIQYRSQKDIVGSRQLDTPHQDIRIEFELKRETDLSGDRVLPGSCAQNLLLTIADIMFELSSHTIEFLSQSAELNENKR